jgi:hypothetical protein
MGRAEIEAFFALFSGNLRLGDCELQSPAFCAAIRLRVATLSPFPSPRSQ